MNYFHQTVLCNRRGRGFSLVPVCSPFELLQCVDCIFQQRPGANSSGPFPRSASARTTTLQVVSRWSITCQAPPLNYFSYTPAGSLWRVPKEAFPQHWWSPAVPEGQHMRLLPHSLGQNLSTERYGLFLGCSISVLGMVAATCTCYFWCFIENKPQIWERDYFWTEEKGMGDVTEEILIIPVMFNKLSKGEY